MAVPTLLLTRTDSTTRGWDGSGSRSVAEHAALATASVPSAGIECVPLAESLGRVLAYPVLAAHNLPAFDNSAMDGYALRSGDVTAAGLPVLAEIPAGHDAPLRLEPGTAHRIMTGAPVPLGADTVVPVELTDNGRTVVHVTGPVPAGRHIRHAGEDFAAGDVVLPAGVRMGPQQVAAAAATGVCTLAVRRSLRVGVVSAGTELVAAGSSRRRGQIHDTNGILLISALQRAGAHAAALPLVADRPDELVAMLTAHQDQVDVLVTSGGISAGDHEVVKEALGRRGVDFGHVRLKPGGAQGLGHLDGTPVIALPGNPVACWVSFELFVRPALRAAMSLPPFRPRRTARCGTDLPSRTGRSEYVPGMLDPARGEVRPVLGPGPHSYRALAGANCLIELDSWSRGAWRGDLVTVIDLAADD